MVFSDRVRGLREAAGLSQQAVAEQVGVSLRQYQRWEQGTSLPGPGNVDKLASVLDVAPELIEDARTDVLARLDVIEGRVRAIEESTGAILALLRERM